MCELKTISILILGFSLGLVSSCYIKQTTNLKEDTPSVSTKDTKEYKRPIYVNKNSLNCTCQNAKGSELLPYLLVLYKQTEQTSVPLCAATLVASNIALTPHKCITNPDQKLYPYESWKNAKGKRHTIPVEQLFLLYGLIARENMANPIKIPIKEIVLNTGYTVNSQKENQFPVDDVAIIILDKISNYTLFDLDFTPACLPQLNKEFNPANLFYRTGIYDGVGGLFPDDPTIEQRTQIDVQTMHAKDCQAEINPGFNYTKEPFCVRFRNPPPTMIGGPLHIVDVNGNTFLVGIATKIGYTNEKTNHHYAYFTNVIPSVKFIERYASMHKSDWCLTPSFPAASVKAYPWEGNYVPPPRKEVKTCVCGIKNSGSVPAGSRIAGGEEATPYELPWMVKLFLNTSAGCCAECGASIISDRVILTAAHCVVDSRKQNPTEKDIFRGDQVIALVRAHNPPSDQQQLQVPIIKVIVHPDYLKHFGKGIIDGDIALLIANDKIPFLPGDKVEPVGLRPICLPKWDEKIEVVGKIAEQSGWGLTNVSDVTSGSKVLKKIRFPIRPLKECAKYARPVITNHVICAGTLNVTQSSAQGDSGGPLSIQHGNNNVWYQVGTVSFDARNPILDSNHNQIGWGKHPVFYANLQHYMKFIDIFSSAVQAEYCSSPKT